MLILNGINVRFLGLTAILRVSMQANRSFILMLSCMVALSGLWGYSVLSKGVSSQMVLFVPNVMIDGYVMNPTYMSVHDKGSYRYIHQLRQQRRRLRIARIV